MPWQFVLSQLKEVGKSRHAQARQLLRVNSFQRKRKSAGLILKDGASDVAQQTTCSPIVVGRQTLPAMFAPQQGHMSSVCLKAAVCSVAHEDQAESGQQYSQQLALDYDSAQVSAVCSSSRPTPQVPL